MVKNVFVIPILYIPNDIKNFTTVFSSRISEYLNKSRNYRKIALKNGMQVAVEEFIVTRNP